MKASMWDYVGVTLIGVGLYCTSRSLVVLHRGKGLTTRWSRSISAARRMATQTAARLLRRSRTQVIGPVGVGSGAAIGTVIIRADATVNAGSLTAEQRFEAIEQSIARLSQDVGRQTQEIDRTVSLAKAELQAEISALEVRQRSADAAAVEVDSAVVGWETWGLLFTTVGTLAQTIPRLV